MSRSRLMATTASAWMAMSSGACLQREPFSDTLEWSKLRSPSRSLGTGTPWLEWSLDLRCSPIAPTRPTHNAQC